MKVKELITFLQGINPDFELLLPGHSDSDGFVGIHTVKTVVARKADKPSWRGTHEAKASWNAELGGFGTYCYID